MELLALVLEFELLFTLMHKYVILAFGTQISLNFFDLKFILAVVCKIFSYL